MARSIPLLPGVSGTKLPDETDLVSDLLARHGLTPEDRAAIDAQATAFVTAARTRRADRSMLDAFMMEYGLSNQEGVALMCLAEALLRVPDTATQEALIADRLAQRDWDAHLGRAESLLVNASTWGLMLTGRILELDEEAHKAPGRWIGKMVGRLGEGVVRRAVLQAIRILGSAFVLGRTIDEAIRRGAKEMGPEQLFSFDMLGEGARTDADAQRYLTAYLQAADTVGAAKHISEDVRARSGISVKLSALYPRYETARHDQVMAVLGDRLTTLARRCADLNIKMSIDAEEADRLELSLHLFSALAHDEHLARWDGLGLVVQAYSKRALPVIDWLDELARETGRTFMLRLVKGAYWDTEIKHAQAEGLNDFPVFTRKANTDLSYLVCARRMLAARPRLYCQFATHNAHTVAAVLHLSGADRTHMEFQRLHGMGELLYAVVEDQAGSDQVAGLPPVRIYAPVGVHRDLLAYLVRRLLENGANSSFVNRFLDDAAPVADVVRDPITLVGGQTSARHPGIALPAALFGVDRANSKGVDLHDAQTLNDLDDQMAEVFDSTLEVPGASLPLSGPVMDVINPADTTDRIARIPTATEQDIDRAMASARAAQPAWDHMGGAARAQILLRVADAMEQQMAPLMALLIREAGKSWSDAVAEVREAVDFYRYYARQAADHFTHATPLPGPTGEDNALSLHGRGLFVCISPWNFPLAIFTGQVTAALAAGNAVLAKPAEQTPLIAREAVALLHAAGVPQDILHLLPGDGATGAALVAHPNVGGVAFTGSTETARSINRTLAARNGAIVPLIAETGGLNVMFVDSTALPEQACDDIIASAFYSAGQRCSALRVLYVQDDIADKMIGLIKGAMDELTVAPTRSAATDIGPIIDAPAREALQAHLAGLRTGCRVLHSAPLAPEADKGTFMAPTLVEIDGIDAITREPFGPILHIKRYRAADLDRELDAAFATGYGLTFGVHTRVERRWRDLFARAPVGNTYINRNMVGAVVGSQPFGGQGLSGTGFKAGGPHYLLRFATEKTLTVNTMASGGNADLLTLQE